MPARARRPKRARPPAKPAVAAPPPPLARDPWAWITLAGVVPLLVRCAGAPLGEPVAEDFDFLHRAIFRGMGSLLDGGGSLAFWRPLAHQVYYAVLGRLILSQPFAVGVLHVLLLCAGALLLYRALRTSLPGAESAMAASFPLLAESTRTILGWPTQFVDLGLFVFSALAIHEISRRRLPTAMAALLAALLCKEVAVVTGLLLPLWPGPRPRRERLVTALAAAGVGLAWGLTYLAVRHSAHLELPHGVEHEATPFAARMAWALTGSVRAIFSLTLLPGVHDLAIRIAAIVLGVLAALVFVVSKAARARLAARAGWLAWGALWFVAASAALTPIHPLWQPNRSQIGSVGLGIAATTLLSAAQPALGAGLVVLRLAALAIAPGAVTVTRMDPPETGAFMDFAQLTRLQHFMREMRRALLVAHPTLPHGANVFHVNMPHRLTYALGEDRALRMWYRDSTLHFMPFSVYRRDRTLPVAAIVEYQPFEPEEVVLLNPAAVAVEEDGLDALKSERNAEGLVYLARAESIDTDPHHLVFHSDIAGLRAYVYQAQGRYAEAEAEARRTLTIRGHDSNAHLVLGMQAVRANDLRAAQFQFDSLYADNPRDPNALRLRDYIAAAIKARTSGAAATP
jgi:hypothetical protein